MRLGDSAVQGEHNRTVLGELGRSADEIEGYIASGALASMPVPAAIPTAGAA